LQGGGELPIYLGLPISDVKISKGQLNFVCDETSKELGTWQ